MSLAYIIDANLREPVQELDVKTLDEQTLTRLAQDLETRYPPIFGTMIYWPHALPDWESEGAPWEEYR